MLYLLAQPGAWGSFLPVDCSEAGADRATASQVLCNSICKVTAASPASPMLDSAGAHVRARLLGWANSGPAPARSGRGNLFSNQSRDEWAADLDDAFLTDLRKPGLQNLPVDCNWQELDPVVSCGLHLDSHELLALGGAPRRRQICFLFFLQGSDFFFKNYRDLFAFSKKH